MTISKRQKPWKRPDASKICTVMGGFLPRGTGFTLESCQLGIARRKRDFTWITIGDYLFHQCQQRKNRVIALSAVRLSVRIQRLPGNAGRSLGRTTTMEKQLTYATIMLMSSASPGSPGSAGAARRAIGQKNRQDRKSSLPGVKRQEATPRT